MLPATPGVEANFFTDTVFGNESEATGIDLGTVTSVRVTNARRAYVEGL